MTADRLTQIEVVYHEARQRRGEDRSRFLDELCGADGLLRAHVETLLRQDSSADSLLDRPAIEAVLQSPPPRLTGTAIGAYEVLELVGAGGMGEVYRARDRVLNRDVALKTFSPMFADPDGRAMFRREAQVLASLNHPNIAAIYGFEEAHGVHLLVLELVEGLTLADRIAKGPIAIDEALPIARQVVEALEAAHGRGIIHRDLKPANIKVRPDGTVKILDFGLAKAFGSAVSAVGMPNESPLMDAGLSAATGTIVGTAAYMSPEQVKGGDVDKRSDVWAFGCVLYEMVTGKPAFRREDVDATLSAVLHDTPDWALWPHNVPPSVRELADGCLEKDRKQRIADISTARFLMNERRTVATALPLTSGPQRRWRHFPLFAAVLLLATISSLAVWRARLTTNEPVVGVTRFSISLPDDQQFTNAGRPLLSISPDGTQIVYVANQRLYLRRMSDAEARPIPGSETAAAVTSPVFSPDGRYIAFWSASDHTLKRIAVTGGTASMICQAAPLFGMSWGPDGILFGQAGKGIMRVQSDGGLPELLVDVNAGELAADPQSLPGNRGTLFTLRPEGRGGLELWDQARIVVRTSNGGEPKTIIEGASGGRYLSTGHIVYAVEGRLYAVAFDLRQLTVQGRPVPVLEGVARSANTPVIQFGVSNTGSLVYIPGPAATSARPQFNLATLDETGKTSVLKLPPGTYESPRVSPDGTQLAVSVGDYREADIWIYDLSGTSAMRRLTFGGTNRFPVWSADGRYVAFQSDREGDRAVFWQRADVSGNMAERLTRAESGSSHLPESWSRQHDAFTYSVFSDSSGRFTLSSFSLRDKQSHVLQGIQSTLPLASEFSPDGRWLSYSMSEARVGTAQATAFVEPFPPTGAKFQISETRRGFHPVWLPDGKRLSYSTGIGPDGPQWVTARLALGPQFAIGSVVKIPNGGLLDSVPFAPMNERNYDVTPDGRRIGLFHADAAATAPPTVINVVLDWFDELRQRTAVHTP
jgi:serine/threonine protein kinase